MSRDRWAAVDRYVTGLLVPPDPVLEAALAANAAAGLPAHDVSPAQGRLLELLARMGGARRILEIGTLGGYSAIWLARALPPGGRLVTLELDAGYAEVARANVARAGLEAVVEGRGGGGRGGGGPPPGAAAGARRGEPRAVRPRLHRRRQAERGRVPRVGAG